MKGYVIAGIGTDIGKTVVAAVLVEAFDADYWKPVQAGELAKTDSHEIARLAPGSERQIHAEVYRLTEAMSPHAAAEIDAVTIRRDELKELPCDEKTSDRMLIVELAGGLMVPLAPGLRNIDLLSDWGLPVVLVSRYYLGSINHTLLSVEALRRRKIPIAGIVFNGDPVETSRSVILGETELPVIAEIPTAQEIDAEIIRTWAKSVRL